MGKRFGSKRALLLGHPVQHSLSPQIMASFAQKTGASLEYELCDVPPADLPATLEQLRADNRVVGLNFTLPHKGSSAQLASSAATEVRATGSANVWSRTVEGFCAHNTDGEGFVGALGADGLSLRDYEILMVGAGGAARGVGYACLQAGAPRIWVWNRSPERAQEMREIAPQQIHVVEEPEFVAKTRIKPILCINATSLGLKDSDHTPLQDFVAPLRPLIRDAFATDLVYSRDRPLTPFLEIATRWSAKALPCARAMLVLQAMHAFNLWMGTSLERDGALELIMPTLDGP